MCPFKIWVNAIFEEIFIFLAHYKLCRKCSGFRPCVQHWYTGTNHSQWGRARARFHLPLNESSCTSVPFNSAHLDTGSLLYLTCFTSFFHFFSKNKINRKGKKKKYSCTQPKCFQAELVLLFFSYTRTTTSLLQPSCLNGHQSWQALGAQFSLQPKCMLFLSKKKSEPSLHVKKSQSFGPLFPSCHFPSVWLWGLNIFHKVATEGFFSFLFFFCNSLAFRIASFAAYQPPFNQDSFIVLNAHAVRAQVSSAVSVKPIVHLYLQRRQMQLLSPVHQALYCYQNSYHDWLLQFTCS